MYALAEILSVLYLNYCFYIGKLRSQLVTLRNAIVMQHHRMFSPPVPDVQVHTRQDLPHHGNSNGNGTLYTHTHTHTRPGLGMRLKCIQACNDVGGCTSPFIKSVTGIVMAILR